MIGYVVKSFPNYLVPSGGIFFHIVYSFIAPENQFPENDRETSFAKIFFYTSAFGFSCLR